MIEKYTRKNRYIHSKKKKTKKIIFFLSLLVACLVFFSLQSGDPENPQAGLPPLGNNVFDTVNPVGEQLKAEIAKTKTSRLQPEDLKSSKPKTVLKTNSAEDTAPQQVASLPISDLADYDSTGSQLPGADLGGAFFEGSNQPSPSNQPEEANEDKQTDITEKPVETAPGEAEPERKDNETNWSSMGTFSQSDTTKALLSKIEPGPFQREADWRLSLRQFTEQFGKGECLSNVLDRLGLSVHESMLVGKAASELMDLRKMRPGSEITLFREKNTGEPVRLEYYRPGNPRLVMYKTPAGYLASEQKFENVCCLSASEGRIKSTLWGSAVKLYGLHPELVMTFADIFRYDVDFLTDTQTGDSFRLLYEKTYIQGKEVGAGRVLAAEFTNRGNTFSAFYFEGEDGVGGYYDDQGRSLKKMFLKSPLQYRRISSHFSRSRMHPILKYRRPHLGVDYSAPTGTPVETIGSGTVTFVGHKGGYGKMVIVRHGKTFTTQYAHLNGYAKGLKKGQKVSQGQLIGYVGSTGLATGPHLDFRVTENGKFIDPLSIKLQPSPPIAKGDKGRFLDLVAKRKAEMIRLLASAPQSVSQQ